MASTTPDSSIEKVSDTIDQDQASPSTTKIGQNSDPIIEDTEQAKATVASEQFNSTIEVPEQTESSETFAKISPDSVPDSEPFTKYEQAVQLRDKLDSLIRRTVQTKKKCDKLDHDNKYLQEYVGNLMNSGDFLSKKV